MSMWIHILGLAGIALAITATSVLQDFREWCKQFEHPMQPLRLLGVTLEFIGIVTDRTVPTAFCIGLIAYRAEPENMFKVGLIVVIAYLLDLIFAMMSATVKRLMPSAAPPPMTIPRKRQVEVPPDGAVMTEEQAWAALEQEDEDA